MRPYFSSTGCRPRRHSLGRPGHRRRPSPPLIRSRPLRLDWMRPGRSPSCPTVARSAQNEQSCVARKAGTCAAPEFEPGTLVNLDHATLRLLYHADNKYAYRVVGLRLDEGGAAADAVAPCASGALTAQ